MSKDSTPNNEELRSLNAILRTKSLTSMLQPVVLPLFFLALIAFIGINFYTSHKTLFATPKKDSAFDIVKQLRDNHELAVLDVTIEKLAVYSSEHQNNSFDFSAWLTNKKQFCSSSRVLVVEKCHPYNLFRRIVRYYQIRFFQTRSNNGSG